MREWASGWKADLPALTDSTSIRVRYAETDAMGWVYYANYYQYFEVGRTELIRRAWKPYSELERDGFWLPVVESGCRYFRGARYDDLLLVNTRLTLPSAARVRFDYRVVRERDETLLAEGFTVHCFLTPESKPVAVPMELRNLVAK
jgi:acyl-CoA thioester hydrolase